MLLYAHTEVNLIYKILNTLYLNFDQTQSLEPNFGGIDLISRSSSYTGCKHQPLLQSHLSIHMKDFFYQICTKSNITSKRNGYTLMTSHLTLTFSGSLHQHFECRALIKCWIVFYIRDMRPNQFQSISRRTQSCF